MGSFIKYQQETFYSLIRSPLQWNGWQTSRGHKRRIFVDKMGEFLWTLLVNSRGQNVHEKSSFWVNFRGHFSMKMSTRIRPF